MKILKGICWVIGVAVLLAIAACIGISLYFTPERITSLIEKESNKYIEGEVKIGSVDYTLFKTFPWLAVTIDSLEIISNSLDPLPEDIKKELPENSSYLASVRKATAKINVKALISDELWIKDIEITEPQLNIVIASDSINNFSIVPEMPKKLDLPEIRMDGIKIIPPFDINFFSLPDGTDLSANIDLFSFSESGNDEYNLDLATSLEGKIKEINIPGKISIDLSTAFLLKFPTPSLDINNLRINAMGIDMLLKSELKFQKDFVSVDSASIHIGTENLLEVIRSLPEDIAEKIIIPEEVSGKLPITFNCNLISPYQLDYKNIGRTDSIKIPAAALSLEIDGAELRYSPPAEKPLYANDVHLNAEMIYDPSSPDETMLNVSLLRLKGEGISLEASGCVNNLSGQTQHVNLNARFGSSLMKTLSCLMPEGKLKADGHIEGELLLSVDAVAFGKEGVTDIMLKGNIASNGISLIQNKNRNKLSTERLKANLDAFLPSYPLSDFKGSKLKFELLAGKISAGDDKTSYMTSEGVDFNISLDDKAGNTSNPNGDLSLSIKSLAIHQQDIQFKATGLGLTLAGQPVTNPTAPVETFSVKSGMSDEDILARLPHTPAYLENAGESMLSTILNMAQLNATLSLKNGHFQTSQYLYPVEITNLSLATDLNRYNISASLVGIGRSSFALGASIDGVGNFLKSSQPTLLKADANLSFTDVDINQLAWGYYGAALKSGNDSVWNIPSMTPFTAADSVCVLIPRNIDARIGLRSQKAEYMQYSFSPLSTDIIIKDGNATLSRLTIGAPYATVAVDWTYSTEKADGIYMSMSADVDRFNFKSFYSVFPQMTEKMPELENFTGDVYLSAESKFLMYPTMFMNAPSLRAKFNIKGNHLQFARHGRVEKITHLMLIKGDGPIHIDNIDIEGGFHDNILQINPFKIRFEDYQLGFGGINNMQGDIYYHLALEKSPFHMPFGVNLEGTFKHPEVRLGGTKIDEKQTEKISSQLEWNPSINIMAYLKHGWLMFVEEAAKYAQKNEK